MSFGNQIMSVVFQVCMLVGMGFFVDTFMPPAHRLYILDVGQGDAALLVTAQNKHILIDGGPGQNILAPVSDYLSPFNRRIDLIILSHPHADHMDGLLAILQRYKVGGILLSQVEYSSRNYDRLLNEVKKQGVHIFTARADEDWYIEKDLTINILFPFTPIPNKVFRNVNNSSLVFQILTAQGRYLFTGDMEKELEKLLIVYYQDALQSDYLKVAHHGSETSSTPAFLHFVKPKEMWISVGSDNRYRHPGGKSLARLEALGRVYRTDKVGTIVKYLL